MPHPREWRYFAGVARGVGSRLRGRFTQILSPDLTVAGVACDDAKDFLGAASEFLFFVFSSISPGKRVKNGTQNSPQIVTEIEKKSHRWLRASGSLTRLCDDLHPSNKLIYRRTKVAGLTRLSRDVTFHITALSWIGT